MSQEQVDNRTKAQKFAKSKKIMDMFEPKDRVRVEKDNTHETKRKEEKLSSVVGNDAIPELPSGNVQQPTMQESSEKEPNYPMDMNANQPLTYEQMMAYKNNGQQPQSVPQQPTQGSIPQQNQQTPFVSGNPSTDVKKNINPDNAPLPDSVKESFKNDPIDTSGMAPTNGTQLFQDNNFLEEYQNYVGGTENTGQAPNQQQPLNEQTTGFPNENMNRDTIKNIIRDTIDEVKMEEEKEIPEGGGIVKLKVGDYIYYAKVYKKVKAKKKKK